MYRLIRSCLFLIPAETAHHLSFFVLRCLMALPVIGSLIRAQGRACARSIGVSALGQEFQSPLGLAAGFDKNADGYNALLGLGFGFVEVGTITGEPQLGNPKPRLFRLPADRAIINRMGFNNHGAEAAARRLGGKRAGIVGVNIGKTKVVTEENAASDYVKSTRLLAPLADYLVVNVSSPNTPGLRNLQATSQLRPLLLAVRQEVAKVCSKAVPILVKIAPDLSDEDVDAIGDLALELKLDGIVATNTTISRSGLSTSRSEVEAAGAGGLSGAPVKARALEVLKRLRAKVGQRLVLIAVGGIETSDDVWQRLEAGATLVQMYTGFIYGGPLAVSRINEELSLRLERAGYTSIAEVYGGVSTRL